MPLLSGFEILAETLFPSGILPAGAANPFVIQGYWVQISLAPGTVSATQFNVIFQETTDFTQGSGQTSLQAQYIDPSGAAQVYTQFFASTGRGFLNQRIVYGQTLIYGVQCIPSSILQSAAAIPQNGTGWRGTVQIDAQNPGTLIATPTQRLLYLNANSLTKSTPLDAVVYPVPDLQRRDEDLTMASQIFTAFWLGYTPSGPGKGPLLGATPPYVDRVVLAFGNLFPGNTTCLQFLQKANSEDDIRAGIAALRQSSPHVKIMLSLIGTPQPPVGWNTGITDPDQFGAWCANLASNWGLDGFDIDNEDLDTFPGQQFVDTIIGMRKAMPDAILTMDTYLFDRDQAVIKQLAPYLTGINTMAYFLDFDAMTALVEQYATVIAPAKISIGVKSDKVGPITQGTSVQETAQLSAWNPAGGAKQGMMLWNLSSDIASITGEPDGTWTRTIHENLP